MNTIEHKNEQLWTEDYSIMNKKVFKFIKELKKKIEQKWKENWTSLNIKMNIYEQKSVHLYDIV